MKFVTLLWLCFASLTSRSAEPVALLCTPSPTTCAPVNTTNKFDPSLQRLLVEQQLQAHSAYWQAIYLYMPVVSDGEQKELQIRYLEELLARQRAKSAKD
ncbi:MAG TPA: hypothetical protein VET48_08490 [Steroidobacteraceae bacterium]|nr:hypothetical protein [Steroidobacteraceae bacterium]